MTWLPTFLLCASLVALGFAGGIVFTVLAKGAIKRVGSAGPEDRE